MSGSESEDGSVISVAGVAEGGLGPVGVGGAAHLVGDLDGDLLAHGPGDLPGVLVGHLVALPVHLLLALGAAGVASVSGLSLGVPLAVSVTMGDNLGVVTNNSGAVVNLLGHGVAVLGHDVLALLGVGGVHDGVVLLVAALLDLDVVLGVAVGLVIAVLELSTSISAIGNTPHAAPQDSENQDCGSEHVHDVEQNLFPSVCVNRS